MMAVHHGVPASRLTIQSTLQAVAARVHVADLEITTCSLYLPPGEAFPGTELRQLVQELPSPVLVVGDFNAHSTVWGCITTGTRGHLLESIITDESLCVLNTGERTHFTLPSGQTSALDLSLTSPQLSILFKWSVHDDPLGSDHFPVWLQFQNSPVLGSRPRKWNMAKADWNGFQTMLEESLPRQTETTMSAEQFSSMLLDCAEKCIPRTSGLPHRPLSHGGHLPAVKPFGHEKEHIENLIGVAQPKISLYLERQGLLLAEPSRRRKQRLGALTLTQ